MQGVVSFNICWKISRNTHIAMHRYVCWACIIACKRFSKLPEIQSLPVTAPVCLIPIMAWAQSLNDCIIFFMLHRLFLRARTFLFPTKHVCAFHVNQPFSVWRNKSNNVGLNYYINIEINFTIWAALCVAKQDARLKRYIRLPHMILVDMCHTRGFNVQVCIYHPCQF